LLPTLVYQTFKAGRYEGRVHPGTLGIAEEAISTYDYIDLEELKEAYLAAMPQLGI